MASVHQGDRSLGEYVVRNLSAGGALLISGPVLPPGTRCRVLLRGAGVESLSLEGETLRSAPASGEAGLAVVFCDLSPETEAELLDLVEQAPLSLDRPGVLVVDPEASVLASLAADLALLGRRPLLALTALEAVRWLCDPKARVEAAFVAFHGAAGVGPDLLAFVAEEFPRVHRILMHGDVPAGELLAAIEESNARAMLCQPWTGAELAAALRREPRRGSLHASLSRAS